MLHLVVVHQRAVVERAAKHFPGTQLCIVQYHTPTDYRLHFDQIAQYQRDTPWEATPNGGSRSGHTTPLTNVMVSWFAGTVVSNTVEQLRSTTVVLTSLAIPAGTFVK
jgi:hypothetical protein